MTGEIDRSQFAGWRSFALRWIYRVGYLAFHPIWYLRAPTIHGVAVMVWHDGELLQILHSYRPGWAVPAGGVEAGEDSLVAACRELREEVGVELSPERLEFLGTIQDRTEFRLAKTRFHRCELTQRPQVQIDGRELVDARWGDPEQLQNDQMWPQLVTALERWQGRSRDR